MTCCIQIKSSELFSVLHFSHTFTIRQQVIQKHTWRQLRGVCSSCGGVRFNVNHVKKQCQVQYTKMQE